MTQIEKTASRILKAVIGTIFDDMKCNLSLEQETQLVYLHTPGLVQILKEEIFNMIDKEL